MNIVITRTTNKKKHTKKHNNKAIYELKWSIENGPIIKKEEEKKIQE